MVLEKNIETNIPHEFIHQKKKNQLKTLANKIQHNTKIVLYNFEVELNPRNTRLISHMKIN